MRAVLLLLAALTLTLFSPLCSAQRNENASLVTCANGETPQDFFFGTTHLGVDCSCGTGTFGSQCASCLFTESGTWSEITVFTASKVLAFSLSLAGIAMFIGIMRIALFWTRRQDYYEAAVRVPGEGGPSSSTEMTTTKESGAGSDDPATVMTSKVTKKTRSTLNSKLVAPGLVPEWDVIAILFLTGMTVYVVFVSVPRPFDAQVRTWPFGLFPNYKSCALNGAGIFAGLALMTASSMYLTACLYSIASVHSIPAAFTGEKVKTTKQTVFPLSAFESFVDVHRAYNMNIKYILIVVLFSLIMARVLVAYARDDRTCCERSLTSTKADYGFNIVIAVGLGINILFGIWYLLRYIWSGLNITERGDQSVDYWDNARIETIQAQMTGSRFPVYGRFGLSVFFLGRLLLELFGLVLISLDLHAHDEANIAKTEPIMKGYIAFCVILAWFFWQSFLYWYYAERGMQTLLGQGDGDFSYLARTKSSKLSGIQKARTEYCQYFEGDCENYWECRVSPYTMTSSGMMLYIALRGQCDTIA